MAFEILCGVVGGLSIFLLGMKNMSEGMQAIAGKRLRRMISAVTDNRLVACGVGAGITSLIQSSSVTTVMTIGLVNAGVMTLLQAVGVILGADIGTTVTAWIVALDILEYGLPTLGVAGLFFLFSKNERLRYTAMMLMGVGMVFFGLQLMKGGFHPLRHNEEFIALFSRFEPRDYVGVMKCVLVGALVTAVVQSSSATIAITITLARAGVIGYEAAVALVLGENIGTTITAYLASLGASTSAKRVAYAHIVIKVVGVALIVPLFFVYMGLLRRMVGDGVDVAKRIALSHSMFNVLLVCLFLPLRTVLASALCRLVPDKPHKEPPRLTYLDVRLLDTPAFGIQQSFDEIVRMSDGTRKMMDWLKDAIADSGRDEERERKLFHREEVLDIMQREVVEFLSNLLSGSVPHEVMVEARKQLRMADEYESISDYIRGVLKLELKMRNLGLRISEAGKEELMSLHGQVADYVQMVSDAVRTSNPSVLSRALSQGDSITHLVKAHREAHLRRVEAQHCSPLASLAFTDMLTSYRKIKDHALNIAEALGG